MVVVVGGAVCKTVAAVAVIGMAGNTVVPYPDIL
jgi:hypothetical protein